ncbi:MAG: hypothetical protein WBG17_09625 [Burkholderiaceae bacterium]
MTHDTTLRALRESLDDLRCERIALPEFNRLWRAQSALLAALPARYAQVMEDVLGRLESSALFAEASCSFDQRDLLDNLGLWLDKARQAAAGAP